MRTTLSGLHRLGMLRRFAIALLTVEATAVLIEKTTDRDPLPDWLDIVLALCGLCALVLFSAAETFATRLNRRMISDARDLATRREDDEEQRLTRRASRERIENILEGHALPTMVFQPIVDLRTGETVGYEALSRFDAGSPVAWFAEANRAGLGVELELKAITRALDQFAEFPADAFLSLNCSPATLLTDALDDLVSHHPGQRIVVELTEQTQVDDYRSCRAAADRLRARGVRLAIDDLGAGYSSLQRVIALQPEIIKLDRSLIQVADPAGHAMVRTLVTLGQLTGATLVAEGIEDAASLGAVRELGVPLGQGFHLGRPGPLTLRADAVPVPVTPR